MDACSPGREPRPRWELLTHVRPDAPDVTFEVSAAVLTASVVGVVGCCNDDRADGLGTRGVRIDVGSDDEVDALVRTCQSERSAHAVDITWLVGAEKHP